MSAFNPSEFLSAVTTEAAKRRPPLQAGKDYIGTLGAPISRTSAGKKDPSKSYTFVDFPVVVDLTADPAEHQRVGQDSVRLQYSVGIDFNDAGKLDWSPGRNTGLRLLREATGQNKEGASFSILGLEGHTLRVKIRHEEYPEGSGELQDRVQAVAKA